MLVALDVRLHVLRGHQSHLMPKRAQLARPVVGRRTRFQPDHAARKSAEECQHLVASQPAAQNRRTFRIDAVNLKNMLGYIQSDRRNLAHGWLPFLVILRKHQLGTLMP